MDVCEKFRSPPQPPTPREKALDHPAQSIRYIYSAIPAIIQIQFSFAFGFMFHIVS
jgi:hypothetical protein